jgi:hypothetical protein
MKKMADDKPIIKATTPNSSKYDSKIDFYTSNPRGPHESIHIAVDSDSKSAHIIDTTNGDTEHTDVKCYLTSACMEYFQDRFDDNCYELTVLRWFRDNFVSKEDIEHYYEVAPIIVETINKEEKSDMVYDYIYDNIVDYCVREIEQGNYEAAYIRYKNSVLALEEQFAKPALIKRFVKTLKLKINN